MDHKTKREKKSNLKAEWPRALRLARSAVQGKAISFKCAFVDLDELIARLELVGQTSLEFMLARSEMKNNQKRSFILS